MLSVDHVKTYPKDVSPIFIAFADDTDAGTVDADAADADAADTDTAAAGDEHVGGISKTSIAFSSSPCRPKLFIRHNLSVFSASDNLVRREDI